MSGEEAEAAIHYFSAMNQHEREHFKDPSTLFSFTVQINNFIP